MSTRRGLVAGEGGGAYGTAHESGLSDMEPGRGMESFSRSKHREISWKRRFRTGESKEALLVLRAKLLGLEAGGHLKGRFSPESSISSDCLESLSLAIAVVDRQL